MGILNIDRGNYPAAGLAEHLAQAIAHRSAAMFGRRREPVNMLTGRLLRWLQLMELKHSGWLDMFLPSQRIASLLPHLFGRFREEMDIAPLALTWFDPDWVRYIRSYGIDIEGPDTVVGDRMPGMPAGLFPTGIKANAVFIHDMAKKLHAGSSAVPSLKHGHWMSQPEALSDRPEPLYSGFSPKEHINVSRPSDYAPLVLPILESRRPSSVSQPNSANMPDISGAESLQKSGELPLPLLFHASLPTIEQVIRDKYLSPQIQAESSNYFSGRKFDLVQQPSIVRALDTSVSPTAPGEGTISHGRMSSGAITSQREEAISHGWMSPGAITVQRKEALSHGRMSSGAAQASSPDDPDSNSSADFTLPRLSHDPDAHLLRYRLAADKSGGQAFAAMENMLAGAHVGGPAPAILPHAPAAFVQKKASSPEASQGTSEQPSGRTGNHVESEAEQDVETVAMEIYDILRRRMLIEQERLQGTAG